MARRERNDLIAPAVSLPPPRGSGQFAVACPLCANSGHDALSVGSELVDLLGRYDFHLTIDDEFGTGRAPRFQMGCFEMAR